MTTSRRGKDIRTHSDYYRADDGRPFKLAIIDALTANPDGLTVPGVREWLYDTHHFILASLPSFLRSFGHEQAGDTQERASRVNQNVSPRYSKPGAWPGDDDPDGQVRYALTERLDYWIKWMRRHDHVTSVGLDRVQTDRVLDSINGHRNAGIGVYATGPKKVKVKVTVQTTRTVDYEPGAIDWGDRTMWWQRNTEEELARKTRRVPTLVELLHEAERIFRKDDTWRR